VKFTIGDLVCIREESRYNQSRKESRGIIVGIEADVYKDFDTGEYTDRIQVLWFAINGHTFVKSRFVTCEPEDSLELLSKCGDKEG